jgi:uncharacterized protein YjbJ (UPF0337 family)
MTNLELKGRLIKSKGKLKQKFADLTKNDLMYMEGKKEELVGELKIKLGQTKEELQRIMQYSNYVNRHMKY